MSQEILFRVVMAVLMVLLYLSHLFHREKFLEGKFVREKVEVVAVAAPCVWTLCMLLYLANVGWSDVRMPLPDWLRWAGVVAMVSCLPLAVWVYRTLGVHFSTKLALRNGHELVQSGPYRYVRHPMYATLFLCAVAVTLISANVLVALSGAAVIVVMSLRIKKEEEMLHLHFGAHFLEYKQTTGAVLPKLRLIFA
jgi:protein-S-isoprenylcysteine O-methyltransferase Ste14